MRVSNKLTLFVLAFALGLGAAGWQILNSYRSGFEQQVQASEVQRDGLALRMILSRALEREWSSIGAVADNIDLSSQVRLQSMVQTVPMASKRIASVEVVSSDGAVIAATGGAGVGRDVSGARWFRQALREPFLTDPVKDESGRTNDSFLDLVQPIRDEMGNVNGVLVFRMRMSWLKDFLDQSASALGLDAFLIDPTGKVIVSSAMHSSAPPSQAAMLSAQLSLLKGHTPAETDTKGFVGIAIPNVLGDARSLGDWRMIVRAPAELPQVLTSPLWQKAVFSLLAVTAIFILGMLALFKLFLRPIEVQSSALLGFAKGEMRYPEEFTSSREAQELSDAIAMLQTGFDELISCAAGPTPRWAARRRAASQIGQIRPVTSANDQNGPGARPDSQRKRPRLQMRQETPAA